MNQRLQPPTPRQQAEPSTAAPALRQRLFLGAAVVLLVLWVAFLVVMAVMY